MNKRFAVRVLAVIGIACLSGTVAFAGGFVGASAGQGSTTYDPGFGAPAFDSSATSYKVLGGYRFMKFFAVEGDYRDFGSQSEQALDYEVTIDTTAVDLFAVGVLPVGPVELFGKAGYSMWDSDFGVTNIGSANDSGNDLAYGIGTAYAFGNIGVRVEYELFDLGEADDVSMFSVGAEFRF
jgi:hypothetical protein